MMFSFSTRYLYLLDVSERIACLNDFAQRSGSPFIETDLSVHLLQYRLDSAAMVSLAGLWRANGAKISSEDLLKHAVRYELLQILMPKN